MVSGTSCLAKLVFIYLSGIHTLNTSLIRTDFPSRGTFWNTYIVFFCELTINTELIELIRFFSWWRFFIS